MGEKEREKGTKREKNGDREKIGWERGRERDDENLILTGCLVQTKDGQDKAKVLIHVSNSISLFKNN